MKNREPINLSIGNSILLATVTIVSVALLASSAFYYASFTRRARDIVKRQAREINKQIVLNYETYIESVIETADFIQTSSLPLDLAADTEKLQELYRVNSQVKNDVVAIFLFDSSGRKLLGDRINPLHVRYIPDEIWFLRALADSSIFHFAFDGKNSLALERDDEVISVAKQVSYTERGLLKEGVLLLELNFQVIRNLAGKTDLGEGGRILILNSQDMPVYASAGNDSSYSEALNIASTLILGGTRTNLGLHEMLLNINTLSDTRWRIATYLNADQLESIRRSTLSLSLLIFGISIIFTALIAAYISYRISEPVHQLQRIMGKIERGAIETEVSVSGQREIVMLGRSFNRMLEKIRGLMERVVNEQREKRKTELRVLQNQINPHFLYNSLDSIVWLAEHNRSEDVVTTVVALARFFRISISKGANFISVRDEIDHVKNYLTIQSIRYVDRFTYSFDIAEELYGMKVMKLILQPLVENAIHHGIDEEDGEILVTGYMDGHLMIFEVRNTGYGLSEKRIAEIQRHLDGAASFGAGVGLRNVNQRLKIYYGEAAGIHLSSRPDEDTVATVRIPLQFEEVSS